ncbi:MAG TPA: hypothetical protein VGN37_14915 [Actinocatenispora sp.]
MTHVVYLSRGHGHGHVATDVRVVAALRSRGATVELASYGSGLDYCVRRGVTCADLGIDDLHDQGPAAAVRIMAYLRSRRDADVVVAHEVFAAPSLCASLGPPCALLTHWFFAEIGAPDRDRLLAGADPLVLLDFAAAHTVPAELSGRVRFTGPVVEPPTYDRVEARRLLGIPPDEFVAVVTTGAVTAYNRAQVDAVVGLARAAWPIHADRPGRLVVLSGETSVRDPAPYHRAADVVIANATFGTMSALAAAGVPTVAVTGGRNPVDRLHADHFARLGLVTVVGADHPVADVRRAVRDATAGDPAGLGWATPDDVAALILAASPRPAKRSPRAHPATTPPGRHP